MMGRRSALLSAATWISSKYPDGPRGSPSLGRAFSTASSTVAAGHLGRACSVGPPGAPKLRT